MLVLDDGAAESLLLFDESFAASLDDDDVDSDASDVLGAFVAPGEARLFFARESVMYQPLPLNTMPTG